MNTELHSSVKEFKEFVQTRPDIIQLVRSEKKSWQSLYEDWVILGESGFSTVDNSDKKVKDEVEPTTEKQDEKQDNDTEKNDLWNQTLTYLKKLDMDQVQNQIKQLGTILTTVQGIIGQFQSEKGGTNTSTNKPQSRPNIFSFKKD